MPRIVGVRFHGRGRVIDCDAGDLDIRQGDSVIAATSSGLDLGIAAYDAREDKSRRGAELHSIQRLATEADEALYDQHCLAEKEAYQICKERIAFHQLNMQLVAVDYTFDEQKILFYFTAEKRVDFRELVRDLASIFRRRIELRQIGVRDEARMLGGLASCGRPYCCATFLPDFVPVSIKMAKVQGLSMNPMKISGSCGRLMCCLQYEQETYEEARKRAPHPGAQVQTPEGSEGRVLQVNLVKEEALVQIQEQDSFAVKSYPMAELTWQRRQTRGGEAEARPAHSRGRRRGQERFLEEGREERRQQGGSAREAGQSACGGCAKGGGPCGCPKKRLREEANPEDSELVLSSDAFRQSEQGQPRRRSGQRRRGRGRRPGAKPQTE